jgi:hypothetical protein
MIVVNPCEYTWLKHFNCKPTPSSSSAEIAIYNNMKKMYTLGENIKVSNG